MNQASVSTKSNCNALIVGVLLASANVLAQTDQGQIAGTVRDSSDAVVPSATVTAASTQGARHSAVTGENGSYVLTNLPVGFYEVRVEAPGFKAFVTSNVKVDVAARSTVDFRLEVGA